MIERGAMLRLVAMIPLLGVLAVPGAAQAFCLRHPSGAMLYGCEVSGESYSCVNRQGDKEAVPVSSAWTRVTTGACVERRRAWYVYRWHPYRYMYYRHFYRYRHK
jgi:hypothetical protein